MNKTTLMTTLLILSLLSIVMADDPRGPMTPWEKGAWETGQYRNLFLEAGYAQADIDAKLNQAYYDLFEGPERVYFEVGDDMAYVSDLKNHDARTEGLSYGMMVAVQLDKKEVFDRLWRWTVKYMQHQEGPREAYFAWSVDPKTGRKNSNGSASDGEFYFVTDLLFASNRWGNDTGIDYYAEARRILDAMWSKDGTEQVRNIINVEHKMITFVPEGRGYYWTDPSYHVPAFYEVWAEYAQDGHEEFYLECAEISRQFLHKACHPVTGLTPDYAEFSGEPHAGRMNNFGFDSWRVPMNIALDYSWANKDRTWQQDYANRLHNFLYERGIDTFEDQFKPDGSARERIMGAGGYRTLRHSLGWVSTTATASLMSTQAKGWEFVDGLWNAKLEPYEDGYFDPYYDGFLYLFSLMHLSGNYRIIQPEVTLKQAYQDHIHIGVAVNRTITTGTAVKADNVDRTLAEVQSDIALVETQYNQIVNENDLKWELIHPNEGPDGYDFAPADAFVEFGERNKMLIAGHTLVWHAQTPLWVFRAPGADVEPAEPEEPRRWGRRRFTGPKATREQLLERMRDHIHTVVGRYKGRIQVWDVVNEALADRGDEVLRDSLWREIIGDDFIAKAFQYAYEADPEAMLRYNDYGLENPAKRERLKKLIKSLQEQNIPVHAIGSQTHINVSTSFATMDETFADLASMGLPVHITELDMNAARRGQRNTNADIANSAGRTEGGIVDDVEQRQAEAYADLFRAIMKHKDSVKMVTFWGANDAVSWLGRARPLLFDGNNQPKPAFDAVIRVATEAMDHDDHLLAPYFRSTTSGPKSPDPDGFIQRWLLLEPIKKDLRTNAIFTESYIRDTFATEFFPDQFEIIPHDGDQVTVADEVLTWHALDSKLFNVKLFRFASGLEKPIYGVLFWAVTIIDCPREIKDVRLAVGSNSASMWWINGQEAVGLFGDRRMVMDDCVSPRLTLKQGRNVIRGAVINGPGMSDFCLRLIDEQGDPVKDFEIDLNR